MKKIWLLDLALIITFIAFVTSLVGGPWVTYSHHTAVSGFGLFLFMGWFRLRERK